MSLNPRDNVRNNIISRDMAWNLLSSKRGGLGYHSGFENEESLRNQYVYHFNFTKLKKYWNLESYRPVVNSLKMTMSGCNP